MRYLTQDDVAQAQEVDALVSESVKSAVRLHVDDVVMCELVWVLRAAYRFNRATIGLALEKILDLCPGRAGKKGHRKGAARSFAARSG